MQKKKLLLTSLAFAHRLSIEALEDLYFIKKISDITGLLYNYGKFHMRTTLTTSVSLPRAR
jgi:hypothetical protein